MKSKVIFVLFFIFLAGCGYTVGSLVPPHIKTIYVETFTNKTNEPHIEIDITAALKEKYVKDGNLRIANSKQEADSMLKGEIIGYQKQPLSYAADDEIAEYRLVLTVNLEYLDLAADEVLWQEKNFKADSEYYTTMRHERFGSIDLDEEQLKQNAVKQLADDIVDRTVLGW
jgi:outer membrane lipopolysaccharide assembly protein LptE/RlpB